MAGNAILIGERSATGIVLKFGPANCKPKIDMGTKDVAISVPANSAGILGAEAKALEEDPVKSSVTNLETCWCPEIVSAVVVNCVPSDLISAILTVAIPLFGFTIARARFFEEVLLTLTGNSAFIMRFDGSTPA